MAKVKHMIENDPKRHMYDVSHPSHLLNQKNGFGLTPCYMAALNGHLDVTIIYLNLDRF